MTTAGEQRFRISSQSAFIAWVPKLPRCPNDRPVHNPPLPISQIGRMDRVIARLGPALINAAYAASFGIITRVLGTVVGREVDARGLLTIEAGVLEPKAIEEALALLTALGAILQEERVITAGVSKIIKAIGVSVAARVGFATGAVGAGHAAGAVVEAGLIIGVGIRSIFNQIIHRRIIDPIDRTEIRIGMIAGLVTGAVAAIFPTEATVVGLPTIAFIGGGATLILSLLRN